MVADIVPVTPVELTLQGDFIILTELMTLLLTPISAFIFLMAFIY